MGCKASIALMLDIDSGGRGHRKPWERGARGGKWEPSVLSVQFCCETKNALRDKKYFEKQGKGS